MEDLFNLLDSQYMEDLVQNLWMCPVCLLEDTPAVIWCGCCECQLLLLKKIKLTARLLMQSVHSDLSVRFYDTDLESE